MVSGCILGLLAVVLGAFAAHGLKARIDADALESFRTGVRYQMYHGLFLIITGMIPWLSDRSKAVMLYLVLFGVVFFSGSIYALSTTDLSGIDFRAIGFITPVGGLLLIISWGFLLYEIVKKPVDKN